MKIDSEKLWYTKNFTSTLLLPLSWLFRLVASCRKIIGKKNSFNAELKDLYIIVIGNLTVGGAGKTPLVSYLALRCKSENLKVGIIMRGYKRNDSNLKEVLVDSAVETVGDEALMLKQQTGCPVAIAANRCEAAKYLNKKYNLDVIISDDGLQHYQLPRNFEIVVIDGERKFGNSRCLPAGPLREPISRLKSADLIVCNGENEDHEYQYHSTCDTVISLTDNTVNRSLESFRDTTVHALAGIGYPKRFFTMLEDAGLQLIMHPFPDHHRYDRSDLEFNDDFPILMTEKDAVKCRQFAKENIWYVPLAIMPNTELDDRLTKLLEEIK